MDCLENLLGACEQDLFANKEEEEKKWEERRVKSLRRQRCLALVAAARAQGESPKMAAFRLGNGMSVQYVDDTTMQQGRAWECSLRLCRVLEVREGLCKGARVLELGCGLGVPGLVAARLGAALVLLTDMPDVLGPADAAVKCNELEEIVKVEQLLWGDGVREAGSPSFDLVLCSDLIYGDEEPARKLVRSFELITGPNTVILSMHERRIHGDQGGSFFAALSKSDLFDVTTNIHLPYLQGVTSEIAEAEHEFFCLTEIRRKPPKI
jgi:predicted nicotinamide N-methyase